MKEIRKLLLVTLAAALCALLLTGCGEKEVSVSVTMVNHSGHDISSISITPSTSTEWDTEYVDGVFADGETDGIFVHYHGGGWALGSLYEQVLRSGASRFVTRRAKRSRPVPALRRPRRPPVCIS